MAKSGTVSGALRREMGANGEPGAERRPEGGEERSPMEESFFEGVFPALVMIWGTGPGLWRVCESTMSGCC